MHLNIFDSRSFVGPEGISASANCILVSDFPTYHEARAGRMFEGHDGRVLQNCMASADMIRSECYLTYVIKDIDTPIEKGYNQDELKALLDNLTAFRGEISKA